MARVEDSKYVHNLLGTLLFQSHTLGQLMNGCFESLILGSILNLVESWKALSVNDSELEIAFAI